MNEARKAPKWTNAQRLAIESRVGSLLVAASAGAGKTAVLTERIVNLLLDKARPVSLDRLLVVTFTRAAADEMRQRIGRRLQDLLQQHPGDPRLRFQVLLLDQAQITTIDAFCLWLVQHGFYLVGLDPDFRVADPDEMKLVEDEILDGVFVAAYQKVDAGDSAMGELLRSYGGGRDARYLRQLVLRLYRYAFSLPEPWGWLDSLTAGYSWASGYGDSPGWRVAWQRELAALIDETLAETTAIMDEALRITSLPRGPMQYEATFTTVRDRLESVRTQLANCPDWDGLRTLLSGLLPLPYLPRSSKSKTSDDDTTLRAQAKDLYDRAREKLKKLELVYGFTSPQIEAELSHQVCMLASLVWLVREFAGKLLARKRELNLVDFNDVEHKALELLQRRSDMESLVSLSYDEILVDEYQDINPLQEAILAALAQAGKGSGRHAGACGGDRFLVGDVKQSIYRFRLAEPAIFLDKQRRFQPLLVGENSSSGEEGYRLMLRENFRSRPLVIHGVNTIFRQILRQEVGELDYDEEAELVPGYEYPPYPEYAESDSASRLTWPIEVHLVESARDVDIGAGEAEAGIQNDASDSGVAGDGGESGDPDSENEQEGDAGGDPLAEELAEEEAAAREATLIASIIQQLVRPADGRPMLVWDHTQGCYRPIRYGDIAVLHRSANRVSSVLVEMLEGAGVSAFSEVGSGFLRAVEIETMRALLRVLDNPRRDVPLAALLRSPLIGLDAEQLAQIRIARQDGSFWDACRAAADSMREVGRAIERIDAWRTAARREPLSSLIWQVYRETGFYYYVAGLPGGEQRQANLRAFYDRARQFDGFARQGLSRFVRFLDHLEDVGVESPEAPILGEGDDVVRILSIHKSKGLEMPVVIVAGLGRNFNLKELDQDILFHRQLGVAFRTVDHERLIKYPAPVYQAVRHARRKELLAEELRVLYVALTRARERLILVGSLSNLPDRVARWSQVLDHDSERLPAYLLGGAQSYLDWLGPALIRHPDAAPLRRLACPSDAWDQWEGKASGSAVARVEAAKDARSSWRFQFYPAKQLDEAVNLLRRGKLLRPQGGRRGAAENESERGNATETAFGDDKLPGLEVEKHLNWSYPYAPATRTVAKLSVSEWKRRAEENGLRVVASGGNPVERLGEDEEAAELFPRGAWRGGRKSQEKIVPRFLQGETEPTAAERGTATHLVLQYIDLSRERIDEDAVRETLAGLMEREFLTEREAAAVPVEEVVWFFGTGLGQLVRETARQHPERVQREVRFAWTWPVRGERILIQGTVDCLVEQGDGSLILIDYKTDRGNAGPADLVQRYRVQVALYRQAVCSILRRPVSRVYLVFLGLGQVVDVAAEIDEIEADALDELPPQASLGS